MDDYENMTYEQLEELALTNIDAAYELVERNKKFEVEQAHIAFDDTQPMPTIDID